MDKQESRYSAHFLESLSLLGASKWNNLTGTENPFTRYEFLYELERTGCTTEVTGWQPYHLALYEGDPASTEKTSPLAVMPLYRKTNSWGEYVFDWSWANAYQSHGYDYYPKLVTAAPFTPSHGQRIFVADGQDQAAIMSVIVEKLIEKATSLDLSSWHVLFPQREENVSLTRLGLKSRIATQFHWYNRDYRSFTDFLEKLSSRKRKSIKRERRQIQEQGFQFLITEGSEISDQQWAEFYSFYQSTYLVRGMQGYLKESFFRGLAQSMPEQILMINARLAGKNTAAALFFKNSEKLFGRYWGSLADHQFLHFETCYYQGQEYAIANELQLFDSGAQGEHKIQRGFEPVLTYSNHWIGNEGFSLAIDRFLQEERVHVESYRDEARGLLPFRQED